MVYTWQHGACENGHSQGLQRGFARGGLCTSENLVDRRNLLPVSFKLPAFILCSCHILIRGVFYDTSMGHYKLQLK